MDDRPPLAILAGVRVVSFTQFLLKHPEGFSTGRDGYDEAAIAQLRKDGAV